MKRGILFSAVTMALLLGGCGDEPKETKSEKSTVSETVNDKTLFPKADATTTEVLVEPIVAEKKVLEEVAHTPAVETKVHEKADFKVPEPVLEKKSDVVLVPVVEEKVPELVVQSPSEEPIGEAALEIAKSVSSVEIAQSVASVEIARAVAATEVTEALASVETLALEDKAEAQGKINDLQSSKKVAADTITQVVKEVEAAQSVSAATIASSVASVASARTASSVSDPRPAITLDVAKAASAAKMARSIASVEIAKAKAAGDMAKSVAKVEMNKRLYGEESQEVEIIKAEATGELAKSVGEVKIAQAHALADISKSVAAVEIAKVEAGVVDASVAQGQKLYLKKMKEACGINGAEFAKTHTQEVWKMIQEAGVFTTEVAKICPNLKEFEEAWGESIFDFAYEYASDSGHVPSCAE